MGRRRSGFDCSCEAPEQAPYRPHRRPQRGSAVQSYVQRPPPRDRARGSRGRSQPGIAPAQRPTTTPPRRQRPRARSPRRLRPNQAPLRRPGPARLSGPQSPCGRPNVRARVHGREARPALGARAKSCGNSLRNEFAAVAPLSEGQVRGYRRPRAADQNPCSARSATGSAVAAVADPIESQRLRRNSRTPVRRRPLYSAMIRSRP